MIHPQMQILPRPPATGKVNDTPGPALGQLGARYSYFVSRDFWHLTGCQLTLAMALVPSARGLMNTYTPLPADQLAWI